MVSAPSALWKWLNVIAFIFTVLVNGVAGSTTLLGGQNTAQISDTNPTLITPAGYVFSIWGVIYVFLGLFVIFQALPREAGRSYQTRIGLLFALSSLLNIVWLFLWQYEFLGLSLVLMFLLLATLITIYLRLDVGASGVSLQERLAVRLPFSVYRGWITIASIANVAVTLVSANWNGFGIAPEMWVTLILITALVIALLVLATRRDVAYGLVVIWALVGIAVKQSGNPHIVMIAEVCAFLVAIAEGATLLRFRHRNT